MVIAIDKVIELKKEISDNFGLHLHLHDACGAQSFSFDESVNKSVQNFISEFCRQYGGEVHFSPNNKDFFVK